MDKTLFPQIMLMKAMEQPDRQAALVAAFEDIFKLGKQDEYAQGLDNFKTLMNKIQNLWESWSWRSFEENTSYDLQIEFQDKLIEQFSLSALYPAHVIKGLTAGSYRLSTASGWAIGEWEFTDADFKWAVAYPDQPVPFAADTGEVEFEPTRRVVLLEQLLMLSIYPGFEDGEILIQLNVNNQHGQS